MKDTRTLSFRDDVLTDKSWNKLKKLYSKLYKKDSRKKKSI